jgi:hypothetical protein
MKLLSQITIPRKRNEAAIQLLQGDLTSIPPEHATDILVVSAYPNSYEPYRETLMAALYNKGIFVGEMAENKEIDLRPQLGCWLSKPVSKEQQEHFNFKQILCFEPGVKVHDDKTVVGNIFRCINTFAFEKNNNVIAMPVVASGNQKVPLNNMLPAILEAAIFWLENGLPLKIIKLVLYTEGQVKESLPKFNTIKKNYEAKAHEIKKAVRSTEIRKSILNKSGRTNTLKIFPGSGSLIPKMKSSPEEELADDSIQGDAEIKATDTISHKVSERKDNYDFFISYAHTHSDLINTFVEQLKQKNSKLKIFYDKDSIPPGGLWIKQISDTIRNSKKVLVFLSPDYTNSPVCWDEFQCAKLLEYNRRKSVIQTIYLYKYEDEMPLIMGIYSYLDCREGNLEKLLATIPKLIQF